uniref:Uncharacterized protein n=1 Tax=Triticum urartu TaxID=4572 RepID=A0A8R7TTS0_TRIUA
MRRLPINKHRESRRRNASMNQINEMTMQTFTCKSRHNETPFKTIKSFSKIYLEHESMMIPRF